MSSVFKQAVEQAMASGDTSAMESALADDVVFRSPAVFNPYEGKEAVLVVLKAVFEVFEDFEYVDELEGDGTHGLVFRTRVRDKQLEGWDYVREVDGKVTELTVMIRPFSGLQTLLEEMGRKLGVAPAA